MKIFKNLLLVVVMILVGSISVSAQKVECGIPDEESKIHINAFVGGSFGVVNEGYGYTLALAPIYEFSNSGSGIELRLARSRNFTESFFLNNIEDQLITTQVMVGPRHTFTLNNSKIRPSVSTLFGYQKIKDIEGNYFINVPERRFIAALQADLFVNDYLIGVSVEPNHGLLFKYGLTF